MVRKLFFIFLAIFSFTIVSSYGQEDETKKKNKDNDQEALDESMVSPEQKKQMKKYEARIKKARKEKERKNEITRKQAEKKSAKRLNHAKAKTRKKKKNYVKTHGGK